MLKFYYKKKNFFIKKISRKLHLLMAQKLIVYCMFRLPKFYNKFSAVL